MKLLFGLFTALAAVMLAYYLNLKRPEVRYQLSSPIPTETEPIAPPKFAQQIQLANVGNAVAQKVQVKIRKRTGKITVIKDTHTDSFSESENAGSAELIYDLLRPAGRVSIVLTGGEPLAEQDIEVRHLEGPAKLALTSEPSVWSSVASYFSSALMLLYFGLSARSIAKDHFALKGRVDPTAMLRRRKPLVISTGEWTSNLEEAASRLRDKRLEETSDVSSWDIYKFLNSEKPDRMPADVWDKIVPKLKEALVSRIQSIAASARVSGDNTALRKLLAVPKPSAIFDEVWTRLMESLGAIYLAIVTSETLRWSHSPSQPAKRLSEMKPEGVTERDWDEHRSLMRSLYYVLLFGELKTSMSPREYLEGADLAQMSKSEADTLRSFAYAQEMKRMPNVNTPRGAVEFLAAGKPAFMTDEEYKGLIDKAERTKKAVHDERRYSALSQQLRLLVSGYALLADAPDGISPDEWADLKQMEQEIVTSRQENERRQSELTREATETSSLKGRVLRQLDVINTFINDATVLDRIEDYEGVFSIGNLENLRRLAGFRRAVPVG